MHCTIKPASGQLKTLYSKLFRTKEKPGSKRGWRLSGGRLSGVLLYIDNYKI